MSSEPSTEQPFSNREFWIDTGGTFTDCIEFSADGVYRHCKVLSSGSIRGDGKISDSSTIEVPSLANYPDGMFRNYKFKIYASSGKAVHSGTVLDYAGSGGRFKMSSPVFDAKAHQATIELSSDDSAPLLGMRLLMGIPLSEQISNVRVRLGTTLGTNALLERSGAKTALVITHGFGDLLQIGTQARPDLFALNVRKRDTLYVRVVEIAERIGADGAVLKEPDYRAAASEFRKLYDSGIDSLAICLVNAYKNPQHEQRLAEIAQQFGFSNISTSTQISGTINLLDRGDTTVVDAYLSPIIRQYVDVIMAECANSELRLMTSSGSLSKPEFFTGKDSILSGPAGGIVGFAGVAEHEGFSKAIGFDMGGTSTDVSRYDCGFEREFAGEKAGIRLVTPMLKIETVAAGGGSICHFDGQKLAVGPASAGASPGPACYGNGGPLTLTDINLVNGKIIEDNFPFQLNLDAARTSLQTIADSIHDKTGLNYSCSKLAEGFTQIANEAMAAAIRKISVQRGYDPTDYVMVAFGGAGPQHACAVADLLGITTVIVHPLSGILSAYGLGSANVHRSTELTVLQQLTPENLADLESHFLEFEEQLAAEVCAEGIAPADLSKPTRSLDLRYLGEEAAITITEPDDGDYHRAFEEQHLQLYGYRHANRSVEIKNIRVEQVGKLDCKQSVSRTLQENSSVNCASFFDVSRPTKGDRARENSMMLGIPGPEMPDTPAVHGAQPAAKSRECYFQGEKQGTAVYHRREIGTGVRINGPAIIADSYATIVVDPGWTGHVTEQNNLILNASSIQQDQSQRPKSTTRDPIHLELFANKFQNIASQMGVILQRTSLSVNVKERLDFSCAILDAEGNLVVNAPHIPVHLGAMSEAVKALLKNRKVRPGESYLSNDPDLGGSHLPDLTVMTPVFDADGEELRLIVASRAHHAEIGGAKPGSLYPFASCLAEEGILFRNLLIVEDGEFHESGLLKILTAGDYPSRAPAENIADIRAAIAANQFGMGELIDLIDDNDWSVVSAYMDHLRTAAEEKTRAAIATLEDGSHRFEDRFDNGVPIKLNIIVSGTELIADFTGSGPISDNSFNANRSIVQSALLYCLRCIIDEDVPLNSGVLSTITVRLPEGMLNPPHHDDPRRHVAVGAGNVEISQKIVDVFFGALGIVAASQGTMNNFVFGNDTVGYYETICGGTGAGPTFPGTDAIHSHMTNTRITDVEVFESRYPARVNRFQIRPDSGGSGQFKGGNGVIREFEFLAPFDVSLMTQRRRHGAFGLAGGGDGQAGRNILICSGQINEEILESMVQCSVNAGDVIRIETPGGGGFGKRE